MNESINQELYDELKKSELMLQAAYLDQRFGEDQEFTNQTNSLKTFTANLRERLRGSASKIMIQNTDELKAFLAEMGIHTDKMQDLRETGQLAETLGSTVERIVKIAHPLL